MLARSFAILVGSDYRGNGPALIDRGLASRSRDVLRLETLSQNRVARRFYEYVVEKTDTGRFDIRVEYYAAVLYALRQLSERFLRERGSAEERGYRWNRLKSDAVPLSAPRESI